MAVEMEKLILKYPGSDLKLLAGENGIHGQVTWVHVSELPNPGSFLKGGELVIMTCVCIDKKNPEKWLVSQLSSIRQAKASGVILNVGEYLPEIPQVCIAFCEKNDFPLFSLGWSTDLQEVTRPLCSYIIQENEREHTISNAFKNAIFFPDRQDLYVVPLSDYHFEPGDRYAVCTLSIGNPSSEPYQEAGELVQEIRARLKYRQKRASVFTADKEIVVVLCSDSADEVHSTAEDLFSHLRQRLSGEERLFAGVGKLTKSIRCVYKSYRQASSIRTLQQSSSVALTDCFYDNLGIYGLLLGIEDEDIKKDYVSRILGPLLDYDRKKGSDLTGAVRLYLKNGGSIQDTASELFIHKNTVTYRINLASQILHIDLSTLNGKMQVQLALLVHDMDA